MGSSDLLPAECFGVVLDHSPAATLGRVACVQRGWLCAARAAAHRRCLSELHQPHRDRLYDHLAEVDGAGPTWLRALGALEVLAAAIGRKPMDLDWRDEYARASKIPRQTLDRFGCKLAWSLELRELHWPWEHAESFALLHTWANRAMAASVHARDATHAACTWATCEALVAAAGRQNLHVATRLPAHPPAYANIAGRGGLAYNDPMAWDWLRSATDADIGRQFTTHGVALASTVGGASSGVVGAELPNAMKADGLVCFHAAAADASGLHAMVDVGSGRYALPPLSRITLLAIKPAGTWTPLWEADGRPCLKTPGPLFTVSVEWL